MKQISIIIPCYNATKWLPKCFMSLVEQTIGIEHLELIFVNDASTDDGATWKMLTDIEKAYPESIIVIDLPENRRQGGARNEGIKYASGEYLAFVDADDWILENMCEKVYTEAKVHNADIVQFNHKLYFEKKGMIDNPLKMHDEVITIKSSDDRKKMLMTERLTYGCWNKLYKREMVLDAGVAYAEHCIYEEPLFVYPLLFSLNKAVIIKDCLYVYRQNNLGTMRNDMKEMQTLYQHAEVQLMVWNFMKKSPFFNEYYDEIKAYFLHTYLYEYLDFAKKRNMKIDWGLYKEIAMKAIEETDGLKLHKYENIFVRQSILYDILEEGMDEDKLEQFFKCQMPSPASV